MIYNILEYIQESYRKYPQKTAVSDARGWITYQQLWEHACAMGAEITSLMAGKRNQPVFVCIDRSLQSVEAFLGVAFSGNFYVPIDASLPDKRLCDIYEKMKPKLVLRACELKKELPFRAEFEKSADELQSSTNTRGAFKTVQNNMRNSLDTDPLYCIFTSGSTGVPKGVLISQKSVTDMVQQFTRTFGICADNIFGNQAPFDFDVSVKDIYLALCNGASVHILEKSLFMMPVKLIERLNYYKVNTLIWAVSAMKVLSALRTFDVTVPEFIDLIMFSGEVLPARILRDWRTHLPSVKFVNLYGPTEITCNCTYYIIEREFADNEIIPAGMPFGNCEVFLLKNGELIREPGKTGEICVKGSCLALGYYNDSEKTAAAFCQNPLQSNYPERIYKTGDLARYDTEGNLLYAGRADSQIKHMGHRIELGEIETAACAASFVNSACCLYDQENQKIWLFYESEKQEDKALFADLKRFLPKYMIPGKLYHFTDIPKNRTGKTDRTALRQIMLNR